MNHVTVMYKKDSVQNSGGYKDWPWNEDYYLWIRMLENGCIFENIKNNLVNVRVGSNMSARRGGIKYFKSEWDIQKYMLDHKLINYPRYIYNTILRFGGEVIAPNVVRTILFKFIRKQYKAAVENGKIKDMPIDRKDYPKFSVIISVYEKDRAEWFDRALESIIVKQSIKPSEVVLVVDGYIPEDIQNIINKYSKICLGGI